MMSNDTFNKGAKQRRAALSSRSSIHRKRAGGYRTDGTAMPSSGPGASQRGGCYRAYLDCFDGYNDVARLSLFRHMEIAIRRCPRWSLSSNALTDPIMGFDYPDVSSADRGLSVGDRLACQSDW